MIIIIIIIIIIIMMMDTSQGDLLFKVSTLEEKDPNCFNFDTFLSPALRVKVQKKNYCKYFHDA